MFLPIKYSDRIVGIDEDENAIEFEMTRHAASLGSITVELMFISLGIRGNRKRQQKMFFDICTGSFKICSVINYKKKVFTGYKNFQWLLVSIS